MPGLRLENRVAIVTGAASGIGLESAVLFAQEASFTTLPPLHALLAEHHAQGASIVIGDLNEAGAIAAAERIVKDGGKAIGFKCDVSKESEIAALVDKAVSTYGRLDVMFNNAGIMHPADDNVVVTEEKIWDLTFAINVKGVAWGCKHAIEAMRKNPVDEAKGLNRGGSIINVASFVALMGAATPQIAYTASKGAVLAMTRELAMIHAREGIRFNSLCPGPLRTPMLMDFLNTDEKKNRRLVHVPMGRFGEAIELARGALFLASPESSYMTGTEFVVDGGLSRCYVTPEGESYPAPPKNQAAP